MENLTLRAAAERDRRPIAAVMAGCLAGSQHFLTADQPNLALALATGIQPLRFFVAEANGQLAGIAGYSDCNSRAVIVGRRAFVEALGTVKGTLTSALLSGAPVSGQALDAHTAVLECVGVLPHLQNHGIARALIRALLSQTDYTEYLLEVSAENSAALRCYTACGFRAIHTPPVPRRTPAGFSLCMRYKKH